MLWEKMFCEREGGGGGGIYIYEPLLLRCRILYLSLVELVYNYIQPLGLSPVESSSKYTDMAAVYKETSISQYFGNLKM